MNDEKKRNTLLENAVDIYTNKNRVTLTKTEAEYLLKMIVINKDFKQYFETEPQEAANVLKYLMKENYFQKLSEDPRKQDLSRKIEIVDSALKNSEFWSNFGLSPKKVEFANASKLVETLDKKRNHSKKNRR